MATSLLAQNPPAVQNAAGKTANGPGGLTVVPSAPPQAPSEYVLGPQDELRIWALGMEEISERPVRIDPAGFIDLPVVGRVQVGGLTVEQAKQQLVERLQSELREPRVSLDIVEYGSQPVSVIGAVNSPGIHQLLGHKTLLETLSLAGGLRQDAGHSIKITRRMEAGPIPISNAMVDRSNQFSVAEIQLKDLLAATNPADNITIQPHDVISVSTAELIYVVGAVRKPGGFTLNDRETVSVLQALSMAEGLGEAPAAGSAKILRPLEGNAERQEIPVDLKKILNGDERDVDLQANDILYVPTSASKKAMSRGLEAVVSTVSGLVVWRRF
jgi:polysaccharide export outer membrane protein